MNVLDLFSGIGGFSLGLERAGFKTVAFCENDTYCQGVLRKHWPNVPIYEDVTKDNDYPEAEIITAGFPCQDISLAGPGAGLAGERSGLFQEVVRAVRMVRPKFVLLENVAALLNRGMGKVCGDMAESGYDTEWDCIPTGYPYGHRRERVFIVANFVRERLQRRGDTSTDKVDGANIFTRERFAIFLKSIDPRKKWSDRPLLGRGIPRVPNRTHRIKALGNAVVPKAPEIIGRAIKASMTTKILS